MKLKRCTSLELQLLYFPHVDLRTFYKWSIKLSELENLHRSSAIFVLLHSYFPVALLKEHKGAFVCKEKKKGTGTTYCGGRSSPGFHPLPRQTLSSRRSPRFYSTAFWDPWSSREETRRCRRLQVWREVLWFLPWPSPPLSPLPGDCFRLLLEQRAGAPLRPPTSHWLCCLFSPPLLHRASHKLILLNLRGQLPWKPLSQGSKCPLSPEEKGLWNTST